MELTFVPIARRDLRYASSTQSFNIILAISAPYRPPKTPDAADEVAACMIQDCDDPKYALEIGGRDELEALQKGLLHLEVFVRKLSAGGPGTLLNADGSAFKLTDMDVLSSYLRRA